MQAQSQSSIDAFIDALWLEDGLSNNTLEAYRRDLSLYAGWLGAQEQRGRQLDETSEGDLARYFSVKHASTKATSANRRLTVFKRYFRWALREHFIAADPTLKLQSAKQALRVPKLMSEAQVERLLAAPSEDTALGQRDRAMLELMYASGLRVSELVGLKTFHLGLNEGVLRVMGKGSKERLVPFGQVAREWINVYLAEARRFDLGSIPPRGRRSLRFDKAGTVRVFCTLHSDSSAYVFVAPSKVFTRPDATGSFELPELPAGSYRVRAWHPRHGERSWPVDLPRFGTAIDLRF